MTDMESTGEEGTLLPAIPPSRELVSIDRSPQTIALGDVLFGVIDAVVGLARESIGAHPWTRSTTVDAALGVSWRCWSVASTGLAAVGRTAAPVARLALDPPLVPESLRPRTAIEQAANTWRQQRPAGQLAASHARDVVLATTVDTALESIDLTDIVLTRVDLERIVAAVLDTIDLDDVARERLDLLGLANYVIDGIDLPGIIRESTGSFASEGVQAVRMQSIDADVAVQRVVDRILLRRKNRHPAAQTVPEGNGTDS